MRMPVDYSKADEILHRCKLNIEFEKKPSKCILQSNDSPESFAADLEKFTNVTTINSASVEHGNLNKLMALTYLSTGDESKAINHLVEAHAVVHRRHIKFRYIKAELKDQITSNSVKYGLNAHLMKFDVDSVDGPHSLKTKLSQLPREWYMLQITMPYERLKRNSAPSTLRKRHHQSHSLHLTVLPTGATDVEPFCVTLPKPPCDMYDIAKEIKQLLDKNKTDLSAEYRNHALYWRMRSAQNETMKTAMIELEHIWLREWRILLLADPVEPCELTQELHNMIDKLIVDSKPRIQVSGKARWLLKKIATCSYCLNRTEIARAVNYALKDHPKLANNVILSIHGMQRSVDILKMQKRKTLVLVLDDYIDYIPFEAMNLLKDQPVTRFPCLHVAYAMFKEHEDTIVGGCKIIKLGDENGTFIVNPSDNLPKMEKRLRLFMKYWLPKWKGVYNRPPANDEFTSALVDHDLLMYNGHGSGIQYLAGEDIERLRVQSTVLLFGCSSVKLFPVGGRFPPYGVSNQYLTACSPCILGMLWEVTDQDTDKMTTAFISNWIPSPTALRPWSDVDINEWMNGQLKFRVKSPNEESTENNEPEMLRALAEAKKSCAQYMTAAAVVVRGLPMKIEY